MKFPVSHITSGITPILQPILSNFQSQIDLVLTKYIKVLKVTSIIGTFILVFTFISSNEIILFLFGEQWVESTQSLKFLSLSIWAQMLTSTAGPIFQSLNRVKELFIIGLINSITLMFFIFIGVSLGDINNLAFLVSMGYIIVFFQVFFILFKKVFNLNFVFVINILKQDFFNLFLIFIFMNVLSDLLFIENLTLNLLFKFFSLLLAQFITLIITKQLKYLDFIIVDIKNVIKLIRSHSI
jgi:PST family polysaccharide transporter